VRYQIAGMDLSESLAYLRHHLSLAGRADPLIADDAAARLHRYANGLPRGAELRRREESERGKTVVVVCDEAQSLSPEQLEDLRLLGNSDMDSHSPFACVILGQPTLRRRIRLGTFAAYGAPAIMSRCG